MNKNNKRHTALRSDIIRAWIGMLIRIRQVELTATSWTIGRQHN